MQALVRGLQDGAAILPRLLPAMSAAARITTTAAATATETVTQSGSASLQREFQIYRWHPEEGGKPRYQSYNVDLDR